METLYLLCATIGGTILVVQTILLVIGGGHGDGDFDAGDLHDGHFDGHVGHDHGHGADHAADHAGDTFLKLLSFKTLVAFVTFFGLGGLACLQAGLSSVPSLAIALGAGFLALYLVAYLMTAMSRLQSRGNIDFKNAVGERGRVYLRVPGSNAGLGKITLALQGRTVACKAVTRGPEIPSGSNVRVVSVAADTLEVEPVGKE
jgi:membrane protein implicated in regulation of membrane protease activity